MAASPIAPPPLGPSLLKPYDKTLALGETTAQAEPRKKPGPGTARFNETPSGTAKVPNTLSGYAQMLSEKIIKEHPGGGAGNRKALEEQIKAFAKVYDDPFTNEYSPFKTSNDVESWKNRFGRTDDVIIGVIRKTLQFAYKENIRRLADIFRLDNPMSDYFDANVAKVATQYIHKLHLPAGMAVDFLEAFKERLIENNEFLKNDADVNLFFPGLFAIIKDYSERSENSE